ncbi:transcriptional regulator, PadR family [Streptomyces sp. DvalAA-14]|uniref:PadR family transcriptional regulator n=1 Tax=unclassified Streptomyces TaxID=2593676 RepID=UPI00081BA73F|nr:MULTISPECIES: PadR family transcriptional regulator [unclassified Streptomyces]MYS18799.1 PadR family transcriptional regulator [Streptomyces sp. SID4948]SCD29579.1 transcriptional regulator, PadR family [Streptomyces sp. DvalAA-14]
MSLRHAVLGLLAERPASGYDLMKLFETSLANVWPATQSQVYGELGKLAASGLLTVSAEGPRGRKEYAITAEGRVELRHWLTETEPDRIRRSETLLRVFFLGALTPVEAAVYLGLEAGRAAAGHAALRELEASVPWGDDPISVYGRLALEYGLRLTAMQEEWARWAVEQVEGREAPTSSQAADMGETPD